MIRTSFHLCFLAAGLVVSTAPAQVVAKPIDAALADPAAESHATAMVQAGDASRRAGDTKTAVQHYVRALAFHPYSQAILRRLLETTQAEPDARALWAQTYYSALADNRGRAKIDRETAALLPDGDTELRKLATARTQAALELAKLVAALKAGPRSNKAEELIAQWAALLAVDLMRPAPALLRKHADTFAAAERKTTYDRELVVRTLRKVMVRRLGEDRPDVALQIAAVLRGMASQARQNDLKGPEPIDMSGAEGEAVRVAAAARAKLFAERGEPLTVKQLLDLSAQERLAFTEAHKSLDRPGRALSPSGLYLIETTCGFETLLGVARTIEFHHDRLAKWYGSDPFKSRRGLVRVLPEAAGLEEEGTPYWWAGGFQRGDETTVKFHCSTIPGLGRTLTHELTHRFDGVLRPFQPTWMVEGKAVWTAGAYGKIEDQDFVDNYASSGPIQTAFIAGYGRKNKLTELIEGKIKDYRDNYTAGFALFVYLWSWKGADGREFVYRDRFERFVKGGRGGRQKALAWFIDNFADGQGGRPKSYDGFVADFGAFLQGFYWKSRASWVRRYGQPAGERRPDYVYDVPTWTWSRKRAEPWFGQDHAGIAGDFLADAGERTAAIAAYLWARQVDDPSPPRSKRLAGLLEDAGRKVEAWALRNDPTVPAPPLLTRKLPRLRAFMELLAATVQTYRERGWPRAATVVQADHSRLSSALGPPAPAGEVVATADPHHPFDDPPHRLGTYGWVEDELTGHDKRRVAGNWYETETGDVHVGRKKPRTGSGLLDRRAYERPIFVRSREWMTPGRYVLRTAVHLTTSYARASMVFGYRRRDRHLRLNFSAGDFLYATGEKNTAEELEKVRVELESTWIRDGHMRGSQGRQSVDARGHAGAIEIELLVDGGEVQVFGNGELLFTFHTPDGSPLEGYVGFAAATGAIRLQEPMVQRLDRSAAVGVDARFARRLGSDSAPTTEMKTYLNKTSTGIPVHAEGTVALWVPLDDPPEATYPLAVRAGKSLASAMRRENLTQKAALLVPPVLGKAERDSLLERLADEFPGGVVVTAYDNSPPENFDFWVMFVDADGVLRVAATYLLVGRGYLHRTLTHWARAYRSR